jgi:hypothetical protein
VSISTDTALARAEDGASLRVFLMTIEAGSEIWEKFGHDALWVVDERTGTPLSYNYGMFSFSEPGFVKNFLRGKMRYSMDTRGPQPVVEDVERYRLDNRTVWIQELNLTPAQKLELRDFLNWNNQRENMYYMYDYFRDNCTTRIRDALDKVLKGRIRATLAAKPSGVTYRWQARRLLSVSPPAYAGIELAMGHSVDRPLNQWDNSFLPFELMNNLRSVQVTGPDGKPAPLVMSSTVGYQSTREPMPLAPPDYHLLYTAIGVAVGVLFILLARLAVSSHSKAAYIGFVTTGSLWYLIVGFFGVVAMLLWFATDHTVTRANENILQANVFSLMIPVVLILHVFGKARGFALRLALAVAGMSVLGFVLQILPGLDQFNGEIIGLLMPAHLGMAAALYVLKDGRASSRPDSTVS